LTGVPGWAWAAVGCAISCLLGIDLLASRRPGMSRAVLVSAAWVGAGVGFGLVLTLSQGADAGQQYFAAYILEKALSVDNLFVFALLFQAFAVPAAYQHRVLLAGVAGALVLRGGFITAGAAVLNHLSWVFYVFGGFLLIAALRMARGGVRADPRRGPIQRGLRKVIPIGDNYDGMRFLTRSNGRLVATPLLVVLVAIETTDLVFAVDSIPAAFGVTRDVFIVFTSNAFAILGLRALYIVLAGALGRFTYLRQGMAVLLAFIGGKMILSPVLHVPAAVSLGAIIAIIAAAAGLSTLRKRPTTALAEGPAAGEPGPRKTAEDAGQIHAWSRCCDGHGPGACSSRGQPPGSANSSRRHRRPGSTASPG
jgi:tellurite resistance protein TerC